MWRPRASLARGVFQGPDEYHLSRQSQNASLLKGETIFPIKCYKPISMPTFHLSAKDTDPFSLLFVKWLRTPHQPILSNKLWPITNKPRGAFITSQARKRLKLIAPNLKSASFAAEQANWSICVGNHETSSIRNSNITTSFSCLVDNKTSFRQIAGVWDTQTVWSPSKPRIAQQLPKSNAPHQCEYQWEW